MSAVLYRSRQGPREAPDSTQAGPQGGSRQYPGRAPGRLQTVPRQGSREAAGSAQAGIQGGSRQCPGRHPGRLQAVPRQASRDILDSSLDDSRCVSGQYLIASVYCEEHS